MIVTPIGGGLYTTEKMESGRYQLQVIGDGVVAVMESIDGIKYSRGKQLNIVGSVCWTIDMPAGGYWYLQVKSSVEPIIKYIQ